MIRRLITTLFVLALVGLFSASRAKADEIFTWTLAASPTPTSFSTSTFDISDVPFAENGVPEGLGDLEFFSIGAGNGFSLDTSTSSLIDVAGTPPGQVFSGLTSGPTFVPGGYTYDCVAGPGCGGTLTITSSAGGDLFSFDVPTGTATATPEPSSLALLAVGGLGLGLGRRKFKLGLS